VERATALKKGKFLVSPAGGLDGVAGKVADTFNEVIELNERMNPGAEPAQSDVGKEGKLSQRGSSATSAGLARVDRFPSTP